MLSTEAQTLKLVIFNYVAFDVREYLLVVNRLLILYSVHCARKVHQIWISVFRSIYFGGNATIYRNLFQPTKVFFAVVCVSHTIQHAMPNINCL